MRKIMACLAALVAVTAAYAAPITLDFTSGGGQGQINRVGSPGGTQINLYTEEGFRVRTNLATTNHFELFGTPGSMTFTSVPTANTMSWHRGGSNPVDPNLLFIDLNGGSFDITALTVLANQNGLTFTSSSGAIQSLTAGSTGLVNFTGAGWQNITSVSILIGPGDPSALHVFDDVQLNNEPTVAAVPEPISMIVFGSLVVGGIVAVRRRMGKAAA